MAWPGSAGLGVARLGEAWLGEAGQARRGVAWRDETWQGAAEQGKAGKQMAKKAISKTKVGATRLGVARAPSARAEAIKVALEALRERNGRITPQAVVQAAKNPKSVLHSQFGWDDRKEASLRRLDRARELITHYVTVTVIYKSEKITAPYYVRDPRAAPAEQGYMALVGPEMDRANATTTILSEFDRCSGAISRARRIAHVLDSQHPGLAGQLEELLARLIEVRERLAA